VNEVTYLTLNDHKYGLDIEVPGASILSAFGFDTLALWNDLIGLASFQPPLLSSHTVRCISYWLKSDDALPILLGSFVFFVLIYIDLHVNFVL